MTKILIIEDEPDIALGLQDTLSFEGYDVLIAEDGLKGAELGSDKELNMIILDLMLPKKPGMDVCKELRAKGIKTPIIMLTAKGQEIDKVLGLEVGADDYMTKPFSMRELLARIKAILRRLPTDINEQSTKHTFGNLTLNFEHFIAHDKNGEVELTHKEFEVLKYFIEHKGEVVSRDELLDEIWGFSVYPNSRTIDSHIVKLRKKVEVNPAKPKHILTVHGIGYKYLP